MKSTVAPDSTHILTHSEMLCTPASRSVSASLAGILTLQQLYNKGIKGKEVPGCDSRVS
ncbi:hypothetical protein DPMN_040012 [Dreissena polymorpha]|uniref:Uncharacterized protein n=1 Tax=Dreissena polymorpha TaxID=45954 RepID=A0A9D4CX05_DREPO|nr:hypothetical protein DPMN_040012 [Dreissena polymorpha]